MDGEVHVGDDDAAVAAEFDVVKLEDGLGHDSPQWYKTEGEHRLLHGLSLRHAARACAVSLLLLLLVEHRLVDLHGLVADGLPTEHVAGAFVAAWPIFLASSGSALILSMAAAMSCTNLSDRGGAGAVRAAGRSGPDSRSRRRPQLPECHRAEATTGRPQAMASRFTMPSGL